VDWTLNVARAGWLRSLLSAPEGYVRLRYRVFDARGELADLHVEGRHTTDGGSLARAALDALAVANERVAAQLFRLAVPEAERVQRRLATRVLDACALGPDTVRSVSERASEVFEREAGLQLAVEHVPWRPEPGPARAEALLERLDGLAAPDEGILVALAPLQPGALRGTRGLARPLGRRAVIGCGPDGRVHPSTFAHEVAHLFGALHVGERSSVMQPRGEFEARFLDPLNRRILRATRDRRFGAPLDPERALELERIYASAPDLAPDVDPQDLAEAVARLRAPARGPR
jgi:hypothetical protein